VRQAELLVWPCLPVRLPLLAAALPWVGHAQTRSRGTVCGSVAHADPSAEIPLCLLALGGAVELTSRRRRRRVPAADFFTGMMSTQRADHEMIAAIIIPEKQPGQGCAFREFGRRHGDFAIAACAAVYTRDAIRLAVGGVADRPVARDFPLLESDALDDALDAFAWDLDARDDMHATARYRRDLVRHMGRAVIEEARQCRV
jgi:2-furoyl-CoA dehydrogenase FAD binding subunit